MKREKIAFRLKILVTVVLLFFILLIPINTSDSGSILTKITGVFSPEVEAPTQVKILAAGDIMLGRTVTTTSLDRAKDPLYPFIHTKDRIADAHLFLANLENPVINNCPRDYESLIFCAPPTMLEGLKYEGTDVVVNLANNHTLNYGREGLAETGIHLEAAGIDYVGQGNLVTKEISGTRFGFLGFDFLSNAPTEEEYQFISKSKNSVDVLFVTIHWGAEYTSSPTQNQKEWARKIIGSGADVIIGHHPHWVQNMELIDDKPVYYSLGNFIFDQMWSEKTREGLLVEFTYVEGELVNRQEIKTYIESWAQPKIVEE